MDMCFLTKPKVFIWLTVSCIDREKWLFCLLFVSKSSWHPYPQWVFKHSATSINSICSHPSPCPAHGYMAAFSTFMCLSSVLWTNFLVQNICMLVGTRFTHDVPPIGPNPGARGHGFASHCFTGKTRDEPLYKMRRIRLKS